MRIYLINSIRDTKLIEGKSVFNKVTGKSNILKLPISNLIVDFTTLTKTFSNKLAGKDFTITGIIHMTH